MPDDNRPDPSSQLQLKRHEDLPDGGRTIVHQCPVCDSEVRSVDDDYIPGDPITYAFHRPHLSDDEVEWLKSRQSEEQRSWDGVVREEA